MRRLLICILCAFVSPTVWADIPPSKPMMPNGPGVEAGGAHIVITVKGMVCAFCVQGVEKKLRSLPNVKDLAINLKARKVSLWVEGALPPDDMITEKIKDAGYEVEFIERAHQVAPTPQSP